MHAKIIVGAGYGDEGKGLTTDYLCHEALQANRKPIVVRANGGTQAAHTVVTPTGQRHVFHHHGSGSFLGVPTYLGPQFLVNPIGFRIERREMPAQARGTVYRSGQALFTLPVDMMLNQLSEEMRGQGKHGSCGWGIGECVERSTVLGLPVIGRTLQQGLLNVETLAEISRQLVQHRLGPNLDAAGVSAEWQARLTDTNVIERWLEDCEFFLQNTTELPTADLAQVADTLIFEGAQGLGLDQNSKHFPHVTRSNTGSVNPVALMRMVDQGGSLFTHLETLYVTRTYATRHGAGPLEHEGEAHGCVVQDPTNIHNQWQGSLRSAPLDTEVLAARISEDFVKVQKQYPQAEISLMLTCLDQVTEQYRVYTKRGLHTDMQPAMAGGAIMGTACRYIADKTGVFPAVNFLRSRGPTRSDVKRSPLLALSALTQLAESMH